MDGDSWRGGERERDGRGEKGEGGEVGMEMERDGASQHDRMTDGLSDEEGGKEGRRKGKQTLSMPPSLTSGSGVYVCVQTWLGSKLAQTVGHDSLVVSS